MCWERQVCRVPLARNCADGTTTQTGQPSGTPSVSYAHFITKSTSSPHLFYALTIGRCPGSNDSDQLVLSKVLQKPKNLSMTRIISAPEFSPHNDPEDLLIVVDDNVYDMTEFATEHPGGDASMCSFLSLLPLLTIW